MSGTHSNLILIVESQKEINHYCGIQILTELLSLKYYELLPFTLPTLISCLDGNGTYYILWFVNISPFYRTESKDI